MDICNKLTKIQFNGFAPIKWDSLFIRLEYELKYSTKEKKMIKIILQVLFRIIFNKRDCILSIKNEKPILYIQDSERTSCQILFREIAKYIKSDTIQYNKNKHIKIHNIKCIFSMFFIYVPSWVKSLKSVRLPLKIKMILISELIPIWYLQNKIKNININHYRLLIASYDSFLTESYLVELFKYHGIPTVSFQHGVFVGKRADTMVHSGVEFASFKSDYLFCWNKFTIDEAIKAGISPEKLILTGILNFFGKKAEKCVQPQNKIFGVVLSHPEFEKENIELIKSANQLAQSIGYHFYLKLHPNYIESYFDNYVNKEYFLGIIPKGISMLEYANKVEFSIIGSSSVFVEMIFLRHEVLRLSDQDITDKYRNVNIGKIFHNADEIREVYHREKLNKYNNELFDYLCSIEDVTSEYIKAINKCVANGYIK